MAKQSALAEERTALVLEIEQTRNQIVEAEAALKESESTVKEMQGRCALPRAIGSVPRLSSRRVSYRLRDQAQDTLAQMQAPQRHAERGPSSGHASTMPRRPRSAFSCANARCKRWKRRSRRHEASVRLVQTEVERSKSRQDRLPILEARLKEARAKAERARQSLQDTVLQSPIDGVISRKRVEEGQLVQNGQPVLVISDPKDVWIWRILRNHTSVRWQWANRYHGGCLPGPAF